MSWNNETEAGIMFCLVEEVIVLGTWIISWMIGLGTPHGTSSNSKDDGIGAVE